MLLGRHNLEQDLVREVREQAEVRPGTTCMKWISQEYLQSNSALTEVLMTICKVFWYNNGSMCFATPSGNSHGI